MFARRILAALLVIAPLAGPARAEDKPAAPAPAPTKKIENPTYKAWSVFKVGAFAKYEQDAGVPGQKTTMTFKLVELTEAKAVIETSMTSTMGDQSFDIPSSRRDELKTIEVPEATPTPDQPKAEMKEGSGSLTTPAGTFACKWIETKVAMQGMTSTSKMWSSADVPGGLVKTESNTVLEDGQVHKSSMTLVEVKK